LETSQTNVEALREACVMIESQVVEYEKINASIQAEKSSLSENTEKLIGDLCKAKEEIQESKKLANEEKSLKLLAETKVKRLTEDVECLQNECQSYKDQCLKYKEFSNNLTEELTLCEEKVSDLEVTVKSYERQIGDWVSENNVLKEEVSQYLTQIGGMKEAHYKLKQQLEELKSAKAVLSQRVDELTAELHVKSNYYDEREVKHGSIIKQQTKLIDYLQVKIDEHNNKKKTLTDKLFGHSKKENQQPISLAVNYKDLELELQKQKQINKNLQDENHKLLAELKCKVSPPKLTRHKSDIISPKTKLAMEQLGKAPAPSKSDLFKQSSVRRMYHNIPHRFASKLCKILARCDHCGGQITLGRDVNVCTECKICVHTGCVDSVRTTCGLPQAYAQHFKNSLSGLNAGGANASEGCVNQEGWVKVLR
jgi:citron Rho-interacting kinase